MKAARIKIERAAMVAVGGLLLTFLFVPLLALFATTTATELMAGLRHPLVWPALRLSLLTSSISVAIIVVLGTPLAWVLASARRRWVQAATTLIQLPIVVPPAVAGVALLLAFGQRGWLSGWVYPRGSSPSFTTGAVVMAEVFVSTPFFVQAAMAAFRRLDPQMLIVARSFGASPLRLLMRIVLPLAWPGVAAGAALSWCRALGEFGATLMFAGNLQGRTQTLPLAIYAALESDVRVAQALAVFLIVIAFALLLIVHGVARRMQQEPTT